MKKDIATVKHMIENAKKIALFGHMSPDGDCIGSMLGLGRLLEKQKKNVRYFVPNTPSKLFDFVKNIKRFKSNFDYKNYDLLIFVDFTWINRIGIFSKAQPDYFKNKPIIVFDHHIDNNLDHGIIIKDINRISASEIVFEHTYKWWPHLYDKDIATYFYMGIASDSGNFLFGEENIKMFSDVVKLLKLGANKDLVVENLFRKKSLKSIKFLQLLLSRIKEKGQLLYTYYDEIELKQYGIDTEEAAYGLYIIQNIDGPKIVLLLSKRGDVIRWSLRAKKNNGELNSKNIDCNIIAKSFGWWGHILASGFTLPAKEKFEKQIRDIVNQIIKMTK